MITYWISPKSLDASGSAKELPIYCGTFNEKGEPVGGYPQKVGMASAYLGLVTFQGLKYRTLNLNSDPITKTLYFLQLVPL